MSDLTARPGRSTLFGVAAFGLIVVLCYVAWPIGVAVALLIGVVVVAAMCRRMQLIENAKPHDGVLDLTPLEAPDDGAVDAVRALESELGDDFDFFRRAATLVVTEQYASAARLQRALGVSYPRARRLLSELEEQHLVAPADGTRPRTVLVGRDRLVDLERLFTVA